MARQALSKRTRFEVFKRDDFICMYCGRHPPEVVLEVDHVYPVALGGTDDPDNLTTACFDCNRGKSAVQLSDKAKPLTVRTAEIAEREEQLRGYQEVMEAKRQRIDDEVWQVIEILEPAAKTYKRDRIQSIKHFIEKLGVHEVMDGAEIARAQGPSGDGRFFRYFCGVCWTKIKRQASDYGADQDD